MVLVAGVALSAGRTAEAQEVATASYERGPRFLLATATEVVPVDVGKTAVLARRLSLHLEGATLKEALAEITSLSGLRLAYSDDLVPLEKRVHLRADAITAAAALTDVLFDVGVDVVFRADGSAALVRRTEAKALQEGVIVGRVTDRRTAEPIVGAAIEVQGTRLSATTGDDGRYRIAEVPAGSYTVRARYIGYAPAIASVTVSADQEATADFALEKSAQQLQEVVTTGTIVPTEVKALPTPVTVIDDSLIAQQRPQTVAGVLRQVVPTAVSWNLPAYPHQTSFSVRGRSTFTAGSGMKIFVDGIEAANFTEAGIDPASIARIEVVRGPQASAIYGSDAIGGVIQVFTKQGDPTLSHPQVDAEATLGVIQTPYAGYGGVARQGYRAAVRGGGTDVSYNFGAGYTHTADYSIPVSEQSNPSVYGRVHVARGAVTADITGRYYVQNNPTVVNPDIMRAGYAAYATPYYQPSQNQNQSIGAQLGIAATPWWRHTLTVGLERFLIDKAQTQPRLRTPADTFLSVSQYTYSKPSIRYTTSVEGRLGAGLAGSLAAGFDHYSQPVSVVSAGSARATTGTIATAPGGSIFLSRTVTNNTGYFTQAQLGLRDALFLTAGVRAEQNSNFGDSLGMPLSPRLGLSYVHGVGGATLKVRGSWGRAIKPPEPLQKAALVSAAYVQPANPLLGPERQQGWDAGVDVVFAGRGSLNMTYYDQTAKNLIQQVQLPSDSLLTTQFQNVGRVRNTGVEVEASVSLGPLALRGQYGYTRSRVAQLAPGYTGNLQVGDQSLLTPRHTAGASLAIAALTGTTLAGGLTYVGSWRTYDYLGYFRCLGGTGPCRNTPAVLNRDWLLRYPGFVKLHATLAQQLTEHLSALLAVDNLANTQAYELDNSGPVMGRITTIGLRFQY
jgi:outer membrane receptor protein involved in Fe transport